MSKRKYNLKKDLNMREYLFYKTVIKAHSVPDSAELRNGYAPVKDQGELGAYTSFSACSVRAYLLDKNVDLSELYF